MKYNNLIGNDWDDILKEEFSKDYFLYIMDTLDTEYREKTVYPARSDLFNALKITPYNKVKAVILGQDPYHGAGLANGLCFSVGEGIKQPPSLKNIFKELESDLGIKKSPSCGDLSKWGEEGVLLLNAILTVRDGEAGSHSKIGWEKFTDSIIAALNKRETPVVFILWGNYAIGKSRFITNSYKHKLLTSVHPSPLSANRGFFGCHHFSLTNKFLKENGIKEICW